MVMRTEEASQSRRISGLDVYRGIAILAVVLIHVTGHFQKGLRQDAWQWYALAVPNRALQFAVPAFILLSAFLNMRGLLRGNPLRDYFRKRALRALWPYLLWTLIALLIQYRFALWNADPDKLITAFTWGKGYYHLYFLFVVLQLYVLLPLCAPWFRTRPSLSTTLMVTGAVTIAVYLVNRWFLHMRYPGSVIFWYVPSVMMGMWLATQSDRLDALREQARIWGTAAALLSLLVFEVVAIQVLLKQPANTALYQFSNWIYGAAGSVALFAWCDRIQAPRWKRVLELLGARSMQIYLIHPFVIVYLSHLFKYVLSGSEWRVPLYTVVCILVPLGLAWLADRWRVSRPLFGA